MGINSYDEAWHLELPNFDRDDDLSNETYGYLESELELIDRALSFALDALELGSSRESQRKAFRMIHDLYNQDRILCQMYPTESIKNCLPDDKNETKEETSG